MRIRLSETTWVEPSKINKIELFGPKRLVVYVEGCGFVELNKEEDVCRAIELLDLKGELTAAGEIDRYFPPEPVEPKVEMVPCSGLTSCMNPTKNEIGCKMKNGDKLPDCFE